MMNVNGKHESMNDRCDEVLISFSLCAQESGNTEQRIAAFNSTLSMFYLCNKFRRMTKYHYERRILLRVYPLTSRYIIMLWITEAGGCVQDVKIRVVLSKNVFWKYK